MGNSESVGWIVVECACRILGISTATGKIYMKTNKRIIATIDLWHVYQLLLQYGYDLVPWIEDAQ